MSNLNTTDTAFTRSQIIQDLTNLGIAPGDIVYVHSSLRSVGPIDGGAEALLDCFLTVLGEDGTLAVPTHTLNYVNFRHEAFDAANTPTYLGILTEIVRKHPKAFRSANPTHSSAAIGKKAEWLTANHDMSNPLGYESPLHRVYRENGKILLLGVDQKTNTSLHLVESIAGLAYTDMHYEASWGSACEYIDADGSIQTVDATTFPGCSSGFNAMGERLMDKNLVRCGNIGNAPCQLMQAKDMVNEALNAVRETPDFLLCKNEKCPRCTARRKRIGL